VVAGSVLAGHFVFEPKVHLAQRSHSLYDLKSILSAIAEIIHLTGPRIAEELEEQRRNTRLWIWSRTCVLLFESVNLIRSRATLPWRAEGATFFPVREPLPCDYGK
jgi:hypothetical protein